MRPATTRSRGGGQRAVVAEFLAPTARRPPVSVWKLEPALGKCHGGRFLPTLVLYLAMASCALAQQRDLHIGYVYPAGGQRGTTFQVLVGGQNLDVVTGVRITGTGIQATLIEQTKIITFKEAMELRERLEELRKTMKMGDGMTGEIPEIRKKLSNFARKTAAPALAETVTIQITIAPNAPLETRELRLLTDSGLSNPLAFQVGSLQEFTKEKPSDIGKELPKFNRNTTQKAVPSTNADITLPAILNGQILSGGVDRYHFHAFSGQTLVVAVSARELIPYLADAVPGWFQATVALYDANGNELVYNDRYQFHPDPVIAYSISNSGDYVLEIHDALYRGREDFVYRVTIGPLPFLADIFPMGGRTGSQSSVELRGWNLPAPILPVNLKDVPPGIMPGWARERGIISNLSFAVDTLPECLEKAPDNTTATAQAVTIPILINGRIGKPGEFDFFKFEGHSGNKIVAEVNARRLGSPLDSVLKLTDTTGRQLAFNDDNEDKSAGLVTHHADSYLTATLPADGTYFISIGDTQGKGGWAYAYRLRLSEPRPDFELRVVPSTINVRAGANVPLTVYALRRDGFTGEIKVELKNAPNGFKLSGDKVAANQDQARFTLTAPAVEIPEPFELHLEGLAVIQDREVVHPAVPAEDMMQAFAYHHLVTAQQLLTKVTRRPLGRPPMRIVSAMPLRIPAGGTARLRVNAPIPSVMSMLQFELNQPPDGLSIQSTTPVEGDVEIILQSDAKKIQAGKTGNLIVNAFAMRSQELENGKTVSRRISLGTLSAVAFEITPP